jgi:hypothetical protein
VTVAGRRRDPTQSERDEQFWEDFTEALARFIYGEKRYRKFPLDAARDDAKNYVYNARKLLGDRAGFAKGAEDSWR